MGRSCKSASIMRARMSRYGSPTRPRPQHRRRNTLAHSEIKQAQVSRLPGVDQAQWAAGCFVCRPSDVFGSLLAVLGALDERLQKARGLSSSSGPPMRSSSAFAQSSWRTHRPLSRRRRRGGGGASSSGRSRSMPCGARTRPAGAGACSRRWPRASAGPRACGSTCARGADLGAQPSAAADAAVLDECLPGGLCPVAPSTWAALVPPRRAAHS